MNKKDEKNSAQRHGGTEARRGELPEGWEWKMLGEVCESTDNIDWNIINDEKKYIDLSSVSRELLEITDYQIINKDSAPSRAKKIIETDDVIFATTRPTLKRVTIIKQEYNGDICSTGFVVLRPTNNKIIPKWIYFIILTDVFMKYVEIRQKGASYPAVTDNEIKLFQIPLPPLSEQKRIVAILDEAFAAIDKAKANAEKNLANAKELFESYLNGIFANPGEDWVEKKLGEIIQLEYGKPLPPDKRSRSGKYPVYGANGEIARTDEYYHNKRSIIVGRKGSAGELNYTVEKFWPLDVTYFVTTDENKFYIDFLYNLLLTLKLTHLAKGVKPGINRNDVYSINVYAPSIDAQHRIVAKLDTLRAETQKLETIYQKKLAALEELKKSILKKAFAGDL